ncbi:MAG: hypothetical protein HRU69_12535 [Flammeovirgaceae bacterium]|nr:MAG: hypothetical protein HRU69_12535 [Flammeovirgaceae bacterium]
MQFFKPENWANLLPEVLAEDEVDIVPQESGVPPVQEEVIPDSPAFTEEMNQASEQKPELIKAPKVELPGLKVIGKIDLPEKKKKEVVPTENENKKTAELSIKETFQNRQRFRRQQKNPIAIARERQQRDLEKQKQLEAEQQKQRRTQKYQAKVSGYKRVKTGKSSAKRVVQSQPITSIQQPDSLWGKFKKWLFRE